MVNFKVVTRTTQGVDGTRGVFSLPQRSAHRVPSILVVEDDPGIRDSIVSVIVPRFHVEEARDAAQAAEILANQRFDCVLAGVRPSGDGVLALLRGGRSPQEFPVFIVMCSAAEISEAADAVRAGADDFIIKDVEIAGLVERIEKVIGRSAKTHPPSSTRNLEPGTRNFERMVVGSSSRMQKVMRLARRAAPYPVAVLIFGETGTGKELLAKWIHRMSDRSDRPFVAVNLAAIPSDLIESTLFGHEKGAFTGAIGQRVGKFGLAQNGTLLLDEITELKLELQPKLLRVLQEGEYERVGGERTLSNEARIIAATNRDIHAATQRGEFRSDLLYRLNVVTLQLPPLRERREDIPEFIDLFLAKYNSLYGRSVRLSPDAMEALMDHSWPGNIRELENVIQPAVIVVGVEYATRDDLFDDEISGHDGLALQLADREGSLEDLEQQYIGEILRRTDGHQGHAAKIL